MRSAFTRAPLGLGLALVGLASAAPALGAPPPPSLEPAPKLTIAGPGQAARHEKIEFTLQTDETFPNPYDADRAEMNLEITPPSGRVITVPAFFYQAFEWRRVARGGRDADWIHPTGQPGWRARFAPDEVGPHTAVAVLRTWQGPVRSAGIAFTCVARESPGYVRVSRRDPRFFEFSGGRPFFPIGQNVAFIGSGQYLDTERAVEVFRKLGEHGANFARVWTCAEDWAMAIEARKSAWGRSWGWNAAVVPVPGSDGYHSAGLCVRLGGSNAASANVAPSHPVALRPGTQYTLSGRIMAEPDTGLIVTAPQASFGDPIRSEKRGQWTAFTRSFTTGENQWWLGDLALRTTGAGRVWLRDLSLCEAGGGPELLWEADLRLDPRGFYNQVDSAMLDRLVDAAERHGIYLQLCLLTRDHYMHALRDPDSATYRHAIDDARKLLRYAVARWGYSPHVFAWEYFNEMDPGAPTERFHWELGEYLARVDPYRHLRTTSGWGPAPKHWHHAQLDIADLHWYLRPVSKPDWQDEVAAVLDRAALVRSHATNKPVVLGEFGLADDKWGLSPYMKQDREGVHFHNALWASAFSGLSAVASFWWWETLDQQNAYRHYRPLSEFMRDIPFTTATLRALTLATEKQCRVLAWAGKEGAWAWVFDPQATWWKQVSEKKQPPEVHGDALKLPGLAKGDYRVQWWDTRAGRVLREEVVSVAGQEFRLAVPPFAGDIACRVSRQGAR